MTPNNLENKNEPWLRLQYKVFEKKIAQSFQLFRKNGIEPILIKGWAVSRFYPESWKRITTDIDLCVESASFEKASEVFHSKEGSHLIIDLHRGFRHLDTVSWENLFENSELIEIDGVEIRILSPEDHLRVLCVHWLTDGGGFKDKLWDIYFMVQNCSEDFDWDRCLNIVSKIRRRWIICTIGLAHKYLDLELDHTPIKAEAENLPGWLIKAVEKEWESDVKLKSLLVVKNDPKEFFQQVKKRFPPNPIQATIDLEGDFDKGLRIKFQILNIFQRIIWSAKKMIYSKWKKNYE